MCYRADRQGFRIGWEAPLAGMVEAAWKSFGGGFGYEVAHSHRGYALPDDALFPKQSAFLVVPPPEPLIVDVRREFARRAVPWVCRRVRHTIDRAGMNPRDISEKVDDGIMGEIGSIAVMQVLEDAGRKVVAYDDVRRDYETEDPGWDLATGGDELIRWSDDPLDPRTPPLDVNTLSVKSSRIPEADDDNIRLAIERRDFKILKRSGRIEDDLEADFAIQVYYSREQSEYTPSLSVDPEDVSVVGDPSVSPEKARDRVDAILDGLEIMRRYGQCYLVGYARREDIIEYSRELPRGQKTWPSWHQGYKKDMWVAPLDELGISFG